MGVNRCLRHVMFDGCKWMQVVTSYCASMHIHTLGTKSAQKHSHTAYGCVCIFFMDAKWLTQHMDVAYEWTVVHSYRNDMYQIGKLSVGGSISLSDCWVKTLFWFWHFDSVIDTLHFNTSIVFGSVIISDPIRVMTHLFVISWGLRASVLGVKLTMTHTFWVFIMLSFLRIIR